MSAALLALVAQDTLLTLTISPVTMSMSARPTMVVVHKPARILLEIILALVPSLGIGFNSMDIHVNMDRRDFLTVMERILPPVPQALFVQLQQSKLLRPQPPLPLPLRPQPPPRRPKRRKRADGATSSLPMKRAILFVQSYPIVSSLVLQLWWLRSLLWVSGRKTRAPNMKTTI